MSRVTLTISIDETVHAALMGAGEDPSAFVQRLVDVGLAPGGRADALERWRVAAAPDIKAYNDLIAEVGDWSDGLRAF